MSEMAVMIGTLKKILKAKGITYAALAKKLHLSEASVKRVFSDESFTVHRFEQVCVAAEISISELLKASELASDKLLNHFSEEQEDALASDERLFAFFYLLQGGLSLGQIAKKYRFSTAELEKLALLLDKLKLIELHPGNRVKLLVSSSCRWRRGGALEQQFEEEMKSEFFKSQFSKKNELLRVFSGRLSESSLRLLQRKIETLFEQFEEISNIEQSVTEKAAPISLVVAYRPWSYSRIEKLKDRR